MCRSHQQLRDCSQRQPSSSLSKDCALCDLTRWVHPSYSSTAPPIARIVPSADSSVGDAMVADDAPDSRDRGESEDGPFGGVLSTKRPLEGCAVGAVSSAIVVIKRIDGARRSLPRIPPHSARSVVPRRVQSWPAHSPRTRSSSRREDGSGLHSTPEGDARRAPRPDGGVRRVEPLCRRSCSLKAIGTTNAIMAVHAAT